MLGVLLTAGCSGTHDVKSAPLPASQRLALALGDGVGGRGDIFVVRADGTGLRNLTHTPGEEMHPTWSPDGRRIAFTRGTVGPEGLIQDLYVMDADGTHVRRLTDTPGNEEDEHDPAWSPDGRRIAFIANRPGTVEEAVWTIRPDGTRRTLVGWSGRFPESPTWSSDSQRIAFSSSAIDDDTRIWTMKADGRDIHAVSRGGIDVEPSWRPGSSEIAFVRGLELLTVDANTREERRVGSGHAQTPSWSPDGSWLATLELRKLKVGFMVYLTSLDGKTLPVAPVVDVLYGPAAWSPAR